MLDSIVHTARSFADYYGISRERLARIIAASLRDRAGVFGLAGYGYFRAELVAPKRMEIRPYTVTRAAAESIPLYQLKGTLDPTPPSASPSASSMPRAASNPAPDAPSKYDLELQVLQERATALRQKNVLEQARLRDETVSYCSEAVQILLKNLRADIDSINLAPPEAARLRLAIDNSLADLAAVLPAIIAGQPAERIELELSARRADRLSAARQPQPEDLSDPDSDESHADLNPASPSNPPADLDSPSHLNPSASS